MIEPELDEMGANAVKDLTLSIGFTTVDYLLTALTGGLPGFGHYEITGIAVKQ